MKANQKIKQLKPNNEGYVKIVGGLVALLLMIIVGVLVYYSVSDGMIESTVSETFTFATRTAAQDVEVTLKNSPSSITSLILDNTSATNPDTVAGTHISINFKTVTGAAAGITREYNTATVTYVTNMAADQASTGSMAGTIFSLLPIIALAVVASIIIAVIIGFGGGKKGL